MPDALPALPVVPTPPSFTDQAIAKRPISDAVEKYLEETLTAIPSGKRGQLSGVASRDGAHIELGARLGDHATLGAFADWRRGDPRVAWGVKGSVVW